MIVNTKKEGKCTATVNACVFELSYWLWMLYKEKKHSCCTSQQKVPCVLDKTPKFRILMFGFSSKKSLIEIKLIHWELHIQANLSTVMDGNMSFSSQWFGGRKKRRSCCTQQGYYEQPKSRASASLVRQNGNSAKLPASDWAVHEPTCFTLSVAIVQFSQKLVEVILMSNPVVL